MDDTKLLTPEDVRKIVADYMKTSAFTTRKLTDTPTDALAIVNRRYVTQNGAESVRPTASVATTGQFYLSTDTNIPSWRTPSGWVDGVGSIIAT